MQCMKQTLFGKGRMLTRGGPLVGDGQRPDEPEETEKMLPLRERF